MTRDVALFSYLCLNKANVYIDIMIITYNSVGWLIDCLIRCNFNSVLREHVWMEVSSHVSNAYILYLYCCDEFQTVSPGVPLYCIVVYPSCAYITSRYITLHHVTLLHSFIHATSGPEYGSGKSSPERLAANRLISMGVNLTSAPPSNSWSLPLSLRSPLSTWKSYAIFLSIVACFGDAACAALYCDRTWFIRGFFWVVGVGVGVGDVEDDSIVALEMLDIGISSFGAERMWRRIPRRTWRGGVLPAVMVKNYVCVMYDIIFVVGCWNVSTYSFYLSSFLRFF